MGLFFSWLEKWFGMVRAASATAKPNFKSGFQIDGVDFDGDESGYLTGITPGTAAASKAVVLDVSKAITGIGSLQAVSQVQVGNSGAAGQFTVFPSTASKGYVTITATDNTGDTATGIVVGAQAAARTIGLPDWSTKASADTEVSLAGIKVVADTTNRPGAIGCLLFATGNSKLYVCTTASATAATWTVVGTQS